MVFTAANNANRGVLVDFSTGLANILDREAVAFNIATVINSPSWRLSVPKLTGHTSVQWYSEAEEIAATDIAVETEDVMLRKTAGRVVISREAWHSQAVNLPAVHGQDLKNQIIAAVDRALFQPSSDPKAPRGLADEEDVQVLTPSAFDNVDAIYEAISLINSGEQRFTADSITVNPRTEARLRTMKESSTSNRGLIETDAVAGTNASGDQNTRRTLAGLTLYTSPEVAEGDMWVTSRSGLLVARSGMPEVMTSEDAEFNRDAVAVRATLGVAIGVTHPETAVRIKLPAAGGSAKGASK